MSSMNLLSCFVVLISYYQCVFKFFALSVVTEKIFWASYVYCNLLAKFKVTYFSFLPAWFKYNQARNCKLIAQIGNTQLVENNCFGNVNQSISFNVSLICYYFKAANNQK